MLDMNISPMIVLGLCLFVAVVGIVSCFYSPAQYKKLKHLYKEQRDADDAVYEHLRHANVAEKLLFRWTTKDVEHYYE